jgi:type I restriction enzyme S subunit
VTPFQDELPRGWVSTSLGNIARINPAMDRAIDDRTIVTFVPMRAVEEEGGGLAHPETRPYSEVKKGYTGFLSGDVIMAKITPCMENGKTTVVPAVPTGVCFGSTEFHVLRPENGIQAKWLERFLLQHDVRRAAQRQMTGGVGQMRVPATFLEDLQVPVAPSCEQSRVSDSLDELLSDLDAAVASLGRVRTKLRLYRASVLKAAVDGALTAVWRAQHPDVEPASELLGRILNERRRRWEEDQLAKFQAKGQTPPKNWKAKYAEPAAPDTGTLPPLPEGWCWATVEQTGEVRLGRQRAPQHHAGEHMRPYLRVANVYEDRLDLSDVKQMNFTPEEFATYHLRTGDILLNEGQSPELVGRAAMYRGEVPGCCYQKTLLRFRASAAISPSYALLVFRAYLRNGRFRKSASITTSIAHLAAERFAIIEMPVPALSEQETIVEAAEDQLSVIDHLEADLQAKLESAQALRQAILRHAFAGKLVPQDPNDEPASELLKRIAAEREARARAKAGPKPRARRARRSRRIPKIA